MMARPGRAAAVFGALVAFGAITLMGMLAGSAAATVPGRCTDNVNVRAEPSRDARILAVCEAGTAVETGRTSNGFVQITSLGGWAAEQYIDVGEASTPSASTPSGSTPSSGSTPPSSDGSDSTSTPSTTAPSGERSGDAGRPGPDSGSDELRSAPATDEEPEPAESGGALGGGLLG